MKMNQPTSGRLITFWATAILCISFSFAFGAKIVPVNVKKAVLYKTTPQRDLHLDIYYPETDLKGEYPVVIYTHGGGWAAGNKSGAWQHKKGEVNQGLTLKGFCVVGVQYRLWKKAGTTSMRDCVIDAKDAIRFLAKNRKALHVNTDQVFTFGDSAGGQIAQMLLLSSPEFLPGDASLAGYTYKTIAGVSWYGPCDFEKTELFNHDGRPDFHDRFGPRILKPDTDPKDKLALYREMSPINYLKKQSPPLLMIQGDGDTTIPVYHAYYMQEKAKAIGAPVEILIVKNAGHNWRKADGETPIDPSMDVIVQKSIDFISSHYQSKEASQTPDFPVQSVREESIPNSTVLRRPTFSWDHIPLYMHMRKATAFTEEELKYLAGFPLITLEKTTGNTTYGSSEDGSREAAKAIKAVNGDACVLYYRNVMVNYSTYKVNDGLKAFPGAFLQGSNGNTRLHRGVREVYDLSNPALRIWWVDHCVEMAGYDEIDGLFLDGNIKALEPAFLRKEIGREKKQDVADGYTVMMQDLKNRIPPEKMLVANIIRARLTDSGLSYMQYFDGSYLEGIESQANGLTRVEYLAKGIDAVQKAARQGKIICMSVGLGKASLTGLKIDDSRKKLARGANIQPRLEYCLALFLICAEKYSYFLPHDGYDVNNNRSSVWLTRFPEYDKPLGPPKGPAIQDGYTYTREFESASVFLDIENRAAKITWK